MEPLTAGASWTDVPARSAVFLVNIGLCEFFRNLFSPDIDSLTGKNSDDPRPGSTSAVELANKWVLARGNPLMVWNRVNLKENRVGFG